MKQVILTSLRNVGDTPNVVTMAGKLKVSLNQYFTPNVWEIDFFEPSLGTGTGNAQVS
jgi:hypothetical protein